MASFASAASGHDLGERIDNARGRAGRAPSAQGHRHCG